MARKLNKKDTPGQQLIDFNRAEQLWMIDQVELKTHYLQKDGKPVSALLQRSVLQRIDARARERSSCFETHKNMAKKLGVSERSIERATRALIEQNLVATLREHPGRGRRGASNRYVIVWSEMSIRTRFAGQGSGVGGQGSASKGQGSDSRLPAADSRPSDQTDNRTDQTDNRTDQTDTGSFRSLYQETQEPPPQTGLAESTGRNDIRAAEEAVFACGLSRAGHFVGKAVQAGLSAADVLALVNVFRECRGDWEGPGALAYALTHYRPGHAAEDDRFWPPSDRRTKRLASERRRRQFEAERIISAGQAKDAPPDLIRQVLAKHQLEDFHYLISSPAHERSHG